MTSRYSRCVAAGVEIGEPSQGCVGLVEVFGFVDLAEGSWVSVPGGSEPRVGVEQAIQMRLVGFCEMIRPAQQSEACPEQVGFVCWGPLIGGTVL